MEGKRRVEWTEQRPVRDGECCASFMLIADWDVSRGWSFFEKEVGEVAWFHASSTPERVARAEAAKSSKPVGADCT